MNKVVIQYIAMADLWQQSKWDSVDRLPSGVLFANMGRV